MEEPVVEGASVGVLRPEGLREERNISNMDEHSLRG
jgi:hypothetical protein